MLPWWRIPHLFHPFLLIHYGNPLLILSLIGVLCLLNSDPQVLYHSALLLEVTLSYLVDHHLSFFKSFSLSLLFGTYTANVPVLRCISKSTCYYYIDMLVGFGFVT